MNPRYAWGMRTTLNIENDVYQGVQAIAQSSGQSVGEVVSRLLRKAMSAPAQPYATQEDGCPVFPVKEGAPIIAVTRASELLDEDA